MSKREILAGSTDQTIDVFIQDSSSTTGAGLAGLVFNSASLTCYYRNGATGASTQLALATQTVGGAHSDGGFVEIDATNMKGVYRLDLSDTMVATAGMLTVVLRGATNMAPCVLEIEIVAVDKFDSVRGGLTALPNAAADAAGGLPISDAGGLDLDARLDAAVSSRLAPTVASRTLDITATGAAGIDWGNVENQSTAVDLSATDIQLVDTLTTYTGNTVQTGDSFGRIGVAGVGLSNISLPATGLDLILKTSTFALAMADANWDEPVAGHVAAGSFGKTDADTLADTNELQTDDVPGLIAALNDLDAAGVRTAVGLAAANLDTQLGDIPTVGEFEARTLLAAAYFDPAVDTVTTNAASQTASKADVSAVALEATVAALNDISVADVNAQVVDVMRTDTNSELAQGIPPATPTFEEAVMFLYMALRNKLTVTATEKSFYNDAGTKIAKKTVSDDTVTYNEAEAVSGA